MAHASQSFSQNMLRGNRRRGPKSAAWTFLLASGVCKSSQQFIVALNLFIFFVRFHKEKGNIKFVLTSSLGHLTQGECSVVAKEPRQLGCAHHLWPALYRRHQPSLWPPTVPQPHLGNHILLYGFISWLSFRQLSPERFLLFYFLLGLFVMQNWILFQLLLTCCWS